MITSINNYPEKLVFEITDMHPKHTGSAPSLELLITSTNEQDKTVSYTMLSEKKLHEYICVLESFHKEIKHMNEERK